MIATSRNGIAAPIPVAVASLPLPTGGATEATLASLLTELQAKADLAETQPMSGTVTANAGTNLNTSLLATQTTLATLLTELQAKADLSETQPVDVSDEPTRDLGKVDIASLDQYTPIAGRLPVDGAGVIQPVSGTFWQATQQVSVATLPLPGGAATEATLATLLKPADTLAAVTTITNPVAVTGTFWQGTQPVSLATAPSTPVTGTFWQTTQPVSGTVTANPATSAGKTLTYVPVNQGGAGTTALAGASVGNKHKVVGVMLTMSLLGTLKFTDGVADLTGPMDVAATGGFVSPTSILPYTETGATNRALNLVTTLGAARGVVVILTEP